MDVPIQTLHLFPKLDQKLIELLRSLTAEEWKSPTLAKQWTVKEIASHLLDGNIRTISIMRDRYFGESPGPIESYGDLVKFLNQLNADWVKATKRVSPTVLIELLEITGNAYTEQLSKLDPFKPAIYSVDWAGQKESPNWFHIAREYTEKWHHQQQIREAVNKQGIMTREFYFPLMDTFMQALPYTYRNTAAPVNTTISIRVTSDLGGEWVIKKENHGWAFQKTSAGELRTKINIDPDTAWKLFTKGLSGTEAEKKIIFEGDAELCRPMLSMLSVMA